MKANTNSTANVSMSNAQSNDEIDFVEITPNAPKKIFSKNIFFQAFKRSWKLWLILTLLMSFYMFSYMLACKDMSVYQGVEGLEGFSATTLIATGFFGLLGIIFTLMYAVSIGNKMVAKEVDKGTMSFTLNTPITRLQIVLTKAFYFVLSIGAMIGILSIVGVIFANVFSVDIDFAVFFKLVLGYFLYSFAISGICFGASCWFNKSAHSMLVGAGLPIVFIVLNAVSTIDDKLKFFKYFSLNTLYDTSNILAGHNYVIQFIALAIIGFVCYIAGIVKFNTKDLPL